MAAKYEAEELMNSILVVAHQMLREYREFYPYGGYMDRDGGIRHVAVKDPETDHPKSQDMIETLESAFGKWHARSSAGLSASCATCD